MRSIRFIQLIAVSSFALVPAAFAAEAAPAAAPAPAAPAAAPAPTAQEQAAAAAAAQQFSVNQNIGDWVVRCAQNTIKSPAPCEMLQVTVNNQTKQRVSSMSFAYIPSRDSYIMQVVVPTGVALAKGLGLQAGQRSLNGVHYSRCERDGCYVELLTDTATLAALGGVGKQTTLSVYAYGNNNEVKMPVSLNGFPEALDRMKTYAKEKAVALPAVANGPAGPATPAAASAPAPRPAAPRPAERREAPRPAAPRPAAAPPAAPPAPAAR